MVLVRRMNVSIVRIKGLNVRLKISHCPSSLELQLKDTLPILYNVNVVESNNREIFTTAQSNLLN